MVAFTVHPVDKANHFCPMNIGYKVLWSSRTLLQCIQIPLLCRRFDIFKGEVTREMQKQHMRCYTDFITLFHSALNKQQSLFHIHTDSCRTFSPFLGNNAIIILYRLGSLILRIFLRVVIINISSL